MTQDHFEDFVARCKAEGIPYFVAIPAGGDNHWRVGCNFNGFPVADSGGQTVEESFRAMLDRVLFTDGDE